MKQNVKFSIIIPMHNAEEFILDALKSIEIQQFKNYECLLIDDHSTDNSKKIVEEYQKNSNIPIQIYETNKEKWGPGASRNVGLSHAKGEYILFLDADDQLKDKHVLEKINETIKKHPMVEVILLGHSKIWYNQNGKIDRKSVV